LRNCDKKSGEILPGFRTVSNVTETLVERSVHATGRRVGYSVLVWEVRYCDENGKVIKAMPAEADALYSLRTVGHKPGSGVLQTVVPDRGLVTTDLNLCKWSTNGELRAFSLLAPPSIALTTAYVVDRGKFTQMSYGRARGEPRTKVSDLSPSVQGLARGSTHVSSDMMFLDATGRQIGIGEPLFLEYAEIFDATLTFSTDGDNPRSMSGHALVEAARASGH
jgi:hypothetical protein